MTDSILSVLSSSNKSSQRNVIKSQKVCKFFLTCIFLNLTVRANFLQQCPYWIKDLSLSYKHKTIIETNEMLTDEHIQAAQKKQFQHLAGLQSTLLFQNKGFSPALIRDGSFQEGMLMTQMHIITLPYAVVQVLFVPEHDHWVTTSYHEGEVRLIANSTMF